MQVHDEHGTLRDLHSIPLMAENPLQAEAQALLEALRYVKDRLGNRYAIFSDCQILVNAVNNGEWQDLPEWRAAEAVENCCTEYNQ